MKRKKRNFISCKVRFRNTAGLLPKYREFTSEMPCVCHENARHLCLKCLAFQEQTHGIFFLNNSLFKNKLQVVDF